MVEVDEGIEWKLEMVEKGRLERPFPGMDRLRLVGVKVGLVGWWGGRLPFAANCFRNGVCDISADEVVVAISVGTVVALGDDFLYLDY